MPDGICESLGDPAAGIVSRSQNTSDGSFDGRREFVELQRCRSTESRQHSTDAAGVRGLLIADRVSTREGLGFTVDGDRTDSEDCVGIDGSSPPREVKGIFGREHRTDEDGESIA